MFDKLYAPPAPPVSREADGSLKAIPFTDPVRAAPLHVGEHPPHLGAVHRRGVAIIKNGCDAAHQGEKRKLGKQKSRNNF